MQNMVFFDSAACGEATGSYSFIGLEPDFILTKKNGVIKKNNITIDNLSLWDLLKKFPKVDNIPNIPPFQGGFAGFLSYDLIKELEKIPNIATDEFNHDDAAFGYYNLVLSFDHINKTAWLISTGYTEKNGFDAEYAKKQADKILKIIKTPTTKTINNPKVSKLSSNFNQESYKHIVAKAKNYILEGDIFEVNIAQRFHGTIEGSSADLYLKLRNANSAPFCAYSNIGTSTILSTSPERFLRLKGSLIETRPIKGTIARGTTPEEDMLHANKLQNSHKDIAENIMIVDLMRNDLSKIAELNSVNVAKLCGLESYKNVHHLVSVIQGNLKPKYDAIDLIKACFPGGSITGAPKIRATEIIEELETVRRGPYCGSMMYISNNGCMDSSILIRTVVVKDNQISLHSGGAITLDSDPMQEYLETVTKVDILINSLNSEETITI